MEREIARLLPYILLGMFILGVLTFLLSLQQLRRRRTGAYWRLRRKAGERGGRLFVLSVLLMVGSIVLGIVSGIGTLIYRNSNRYLDRGPDDLYGIILSPEAILTATSEAIVQVSTATLSLTDTPPASPMPATLTPLPPTVEAATYTPLPASATATATATPTISASPTATLVAPTVSFATILKLTPIFNTTPRPPDPGYRLSLDGASDGVDADGKTVGHEFKTGIKRIYLFISFDNMENGVAWSRVLYRDDVPIQGNTLLWSLGASGSSYFFFGDETGYGAGNYEVRLYVGDQAVSRSLFSVSS